MSGYLVIVSNIKYLNSPIFYKEKGAPFLRDPERIYSQMPWFQYLGMKRGMPPVCFKEAFLFFKCLLEAVFAKDFIKVLRQVEYSHSPLFRVQGRLCDLLFHLIKKLFGVLAGLFKFPALFGRRGYDIFLLQLKIFRFSERLGRIFFLQIADKVLYLGKPVFRQVFEFFDNFHIMGTDSL